jgi:hypothetical protein
MWHLDAVFLAVQGERHDLRRAVDQGGHGPDMLVQPRRGKAAATLPHLAGDDGLSQGCIRDERKTPLSPFCLFLPGGRRTTH